MDRDKHFAIASVPIQEWNEVYDEEQAFRMGTIFPELNRQFYATVLDNELENHKLQANREELLLRQIQQTGFVLDDLRLYLDTHPEDKNALEMLKTMLKRKRNLMKEFALEFYPLAEVCMDVIYRENPNSECYCWPEGKIPWEGVCS